MENSIGSRQGGCSPSPSAPPPVRYPHGPLQGDMPGKTGDPWGRSGPAPPASGQGKTRTGLQQSVVLRNKTVEFSGLDIISPPN
jgi:hypothetical protein